MKESIKYYQSRYSIKINAFKKEYPHVYQVLHPFQIKTSVKIQVFNPKLEEQWFEYNVTNLILKHFGSTKGISDELNVSEDQILKEIISNDFVEKDFSTLFHFTVNGESIERKKHAIFYQEYQLILSSFLIRKTVTFYQKIIMLTKDQCLSIKVPVYAKYPFADSSPAQ